MKNYLEKLFWNIWIFEGSFGEFFFLGEVFPLVGKPREGHSADYRMR